MDSYGVLGLAKIITGSPPCMIPWDLFQVMYHAGVVESYDRSRIKREMAKDSLAHDPFEFTSPLGHSVQDVMLDSENRLCLLFMF